MIVERQRLQHQTITGCLLPIQPPVVNDWRLLAGSCGEIQNTEKLSAPADIWVSISVWEDDGFLDANLGVRRLNLPTKWISQD